MVEKDWTFEQVMEAHNREGDDGPAAPLYQWCALHDLDQLEREFADGDGFALLAAIRVCAARELLMPEWVIKGYIRRYDSVLNSRVGSWDEAFGRPYPKGRHLSKQRERKTLKFKVYGSVRNIIDREPNTPIDDGLFERVGAEFGIGKTQTNELYYKAKKQFHPKLP